VKVLVMCLGNICRSPAGEAALRAAAPEWEIDSAGLGDWHAGNPPYGPMQDAARAEGLDLSNQTARRIVPDDFYKYDLILAMDRRVLSELAKMRPDDGNADIRLFDRDDVPDPYDTRDFAGAMAQIAAAARRIVSDISALQRY